MKNFVRPEKIREKFSQAMSDMYKKEVPLYGTLLRVVNDVNREVLQKNPGLDKKLGGLSRISSEKHGAIRLGTPEELKNMARLFRVMGMYPGGYYNLTVANLPVQSTAFRPVTKDSLNKNPFRIFTSLLRLDLLDPQIREKAQKYISKRKIFTTKTLELITLSEKQNGLNEDEVELFVKEALQTFKWHKEALISKEFYEELLKINGLVADIIGFKGPHINHLTPRVLDINVLHEKMSKEGIAMIPAIQGPPAREVDILLRQTSFQALNEDTMFPDEKGGFIPGKHRARFGEIEQRGIALTSEGRKLYDKTLEKVLSQAKERDINYSATLKEEFKVFPDGYDNLIKQNLAYFEYKVTKKGLENKGLPLKSKSLNELVAEGYLQSIPITYEDFLPVSAAGIFKSNLVEGGMVKTDKTHDREDELAQIIGMKPLDPFALYAAEQAASILSSYDQLQLGLPLEQQKKLSEDVKNNPALALQ